MDVHQSLLQAIRLTSVSAIADACGVSRQAVKRWQKCGRLPRSDFTGETHYAELIEGLTNGQVTRDALLERSQGE